MAQLRIDTWVLPSHAQAARVADRTIDLAICWLPAEQLAALGLRAYLIGEDLLYAVAPGPDPSKVDAAQTLVLLDADDASWSSWNEFGERLVRDTGASPVRIEDGGITGPAFFEHVRRLRRPVLNSPKGQTSTLPTGLVRRPIVRPEIYWPWLLVSRRDETRLSVGAVIAALTSDAGSFRGRSEGGWSPSGNPAH
jgi:hypothetical protein